MDTGLKQELRYYTRDFLEQESLSEPVPDDAEKNEARVQVAEGVAQNASGTGWSQ